MNEQLLQPGHLQSLEVENSSKWEAHWLKWLQVWLDPRAQRAWQSSYLLLFLSPGQALTLELGS